MSNHATLALIGGKVRSPEAPSGFAQAVAVVDDVIVAIGDNHVVQEMVGPETRVINLAGRLALPAFGDAHVHALSAGLESLRCNLLGTRMRSECLSLISGYASALPEKAWVFGGGWAMAAFPGGMPTAADLDAVVGGRPAFLPNRDHHSAWVSTAALQLAGIDASTPDPSDGRIERDASGGPTGTLHDGAMQLVGRLLPAPSDKELLDGLLAAQAKLHALGITQWQDACVGDAPALGIPDSLATYKRAADDGSLTASVVGALWWDRNRGLEQVEDLLTRRELTSYGQFRATSVKLMVDGVCETFTAAMGSPYLDRAGKETHHRGNLFIDPPVLRAAVSRLGTEGFQLHFHALGDRAVTETLDALAELPAIQRAAGRHHLAHLQFIQPPDLNRFAALDAVANFQPLWACCDSQMEELTLPYVGAERAQWQYRIGALADRRTRLAFGSDWPVSSPNPFHEIHVAVNRTLPVALGEPESSECTSPFQIDQAVSVDRALEGFTAGVAYVNHDDLRRGSLETGKQADIAVVNQDIFTIPTTEIGDTAVHVTIADGRVVSGDE